MKHDHAVKFNGQYYKAGELVPAADETNAEPTDEHLDVVKKPGRPKKAAGQ